MRRLTISLFVLSFCLLTSGVPPVQANNTVNIAELGAGLAIPFETNFDGLSTTVVITNGAGGDRKIHFDLLNGDRGEECANQSFNCTLTARETMLINIVNDGAGGSDIRFECDGVEGDDFPYIPNAGNNGEVSSNAEQGILWVTVQNSLGQTIGENVLFGDFTLQDASVATAATAAAVSFQGGTGNDGDQVYLFNGLEYSHFPAALAINYLPPVSYDGELLVFTVPSVPGYNFYVRSRILWYDDDENYEDDAFSFQCFDVIPFHEISPGLAHLGQPGHMEIIPVMNPGGAYGTMKIPLLCYTLQDGIRGGTGLRPCSQSTAAFEDGMFQEGGFHSPAIQVASAGVVAFTMLLGLAGRLNRRRSHRDAR